MKEKYQNTLLLYLDTPNFRHHHYKEMEDFMRKMETEHKDITKMYSVGQSVEGRHLWVMEITDNPGKHEPGIGGGGGGRR